MKCFNCGKEMENNMLTLPLFCSEECAEQFERDFNDFIKNLDIEIPDTLLSETKDK